MYRLGSIIFYTIICIWTIERCAGNHFCCVIPVITVHCTLIAFIFPRALFTVPWYAWFYQLTWMPVFMTSFNLGWSIAGDPSLTVNSVHRLGVVMFYTYFCIWGNEKYIGCYPCYFIPIILIIISIYMTGICAIPMLYNPLIYFKTCFFVPEVIWFTSKYLSMQVDKQYIDP